MKKSFLIFLFIYFTFFSPVAAQNTTDQAVGGSGDSVSLIEEFWKIFFGDLPETPNSPAGTTNTTQTPSTGSFPVTDPLPLLNNEGLVYSQALQGSVRTCLNNRTIYEQAASKTGIPWQILAGIHHKEGNCGQNQSLVSGRLIGTAEPDVGANCSSLVGGEGKPKVVTGGCGFASLLDSAIYAGNHLKDKNGSKVPATHQELVKALSNYNGGGNRNCLGGTPYKSCPPAFYAEDDLYVFNKNPDGKHEVMYLRYCADRTPCNPPKVYAGIGVITAAGVIDFISKQ